MFHRKAQCTITQYFFYIQSIPRDKKKPCCLCNTAHRQHLQPVGHSFFQCQNILFYLVANSQHKSMNKSIRFIKLKSDRINCSCLVTKKTKIQTQATLSLYLDRVTQGQSGFSLMGLAATQKTMKGLTD